MDTTGMILSCPVGPEVFCNRTVKRGLKWVMHKNGPALESGAVSGDISIPGMGYFPKNTDEFHVLNAKVPMERRIFLADCGCAECNAVRVFHKGEGNGKEG